MLLKSLLLDAKVTSEVASNLQEAYNKLKDEKYDLILLDIQLDRQNGLDVLKWLDNYKRVKEQPIIMISGKKTINDVKESIKLGASDYIVKPIDRTIFQSKIKSILSKNSLSTEWFEYAISPDSNLSKISLNIDCQLLGINEIGISISSNINLPIDSSIKIDIKMLLDKGIKKNIFKIRESKPLNNSFKLFLNYIGLDESDRKQIRLICKELYNKK